MEQTQKDNIIKKLIDTHTTVSTMESCTSGMIASTITDTEGASAIFPGGYVTYLNETKIFHRRGGRNHPKVWCVLKRMCRRDGENRAGKNAYRHCHWNNRDDRKY